MCHLFNYNTVTTWLLITSFPTDETLKSTHIYMSFAILFTIFVCSTGGQQFSQICILCHSSYSFIHGSILYLVLDSTK